jgi:CHAT domain-containing protein/tetratricopeptide (TPR) repeat protein
MHRPVGISMGFIIPVALLLATLDIAGAETNRAPKAGFPPKPKYSMSPQSEPVSEVLNQSTNLLAKGDYDGALDAALHADTMLQNSSEPNSDDRVLNQLTISRIYLAKKLPERAEEHARLGIKFWQTTGDKSLDRLLDLYGPLSDSLAAQSKHAEVVELANALAGTPVGTLVGHDAQATPILLNGYGSARSLKDYSAAIRFIGLDVDLHSSALGRAATSEAQAELNRLRVQSIVQGQHLLGFALAMDGDHERAINILTMAATKAEQAGLQTLKNNILVLLGSEAVKGGRQIFEGIEMLTNVLDKLDEASPDREVALTGLFLAYGRLGDHAESERVLDKLLELSLKTGKAGQALFSLRAHAAEMLSADRLVEARECLENAARALQRYPGKFWEDRFDIFLTLAKVHSRLREFNDARQALGGAWTVLPNATTNHSLVESNLSVIALCGVESRLCEDMCQREMQQKWALRGHSLTLQYARGNPLLVAASYLCLGRAYSCSKEFARAIDCLASAKQEAAKLPYVSRDVESRILNELAFLYSGQGDVENAIKVQTDLLAFVAQTFGKSDVRYFSGLAKVAYELVRKRCFERVGELCVESQLLFNEHEWRDLAFLPPGQNSGYTPLRTLLSQLACLAALATTNQLAAQNAAYLCAISKGLETEIWSAQAMLSTNKSVASIRSSLQDYWSNLGKEGIGPKAAKAYKLRQEASGALRALLEGSKVSAPAIRDAIPPDGILLDFAQYWGHDFSDKANPLRERRYAVFLTFPRARGSTNLVVERVDLGEAAPIDEAVEFICKRMSSGMGYKRDDVTAALQRLGELVYAPLAKYLTNVSHLIVCPDGQLSRVPFEMLRVGDRFLIEEKTISYVTSGREIVRLQSWSGVSPDPNLPEATTNAAGQVGRPSCVGPALVMGGPDFDFDFSKAGSASFQLAGAAGIPARSAADAKQDALPLAGRMPALRSLSRDYRGIKFPPLPGAEAEARSVAKLLGGDCVLRVGPDAREAEMKATVSPRVLHLATHGFYLPAQEFRQTNSLPFGWPGGWGQGGRLPNVQDDWESPLVRCGIALAGANHAGQITNAVTEDGVLTGLEASLLNLQGTELVILSACDSGTGDVQTGEGVMSLRRAFRIAGAQTVLASHWKVSDKGTSQLMTEFIRRWRSGEPRGKAWREAQLSLLHSKEFSNPYFWAAFTLTGQWR